MSLGTVVMKRTVSVVSTVVLLATLLSACSRSVGPRFGGGEDSQYVDDGEPSDAEIDEAMREADERADEWLDSNGGDADRWSCYYDPTMNDDCTTTRCARMAATTTDRI